MRRLVIQSPIFFKVGDSATDELVYDGVLIGSAFETLLKKNNIISQGEGFYDFKVTPVMPVPGGEIIIELVYQDEPLVFTVLEVQNLNY